MGGDRKTVPWGIWLAMGKDLELYTTGVLLVTGPPDHPVQEHEGTESHQVHRGMQ